MGLRGKIAIAIFLVIAVAAGGFLYVRLTTPHLRPLHDDDVATSGRPWSKVVKGPGHRVHLEGLEPVSCEECHEIEAEVFKKPSKRRCLRCHEDHQPTVHASAEAQKVSCLGCHDFLAPEGQAQPSPWACLKCHSEQQGQIAAIEIHSRERCGTCHRPHGTPSLAPRNCSGCHEHEKLSSARHGHASGAQLCLDCHQPHREAAGTGSRCITCHVEGNAAPVAVVATNGAQASPPRPPRISAGAAWAGGHQCAGCHAPHGFAKSLVRPCRSCHAAQRTIAEGRVQAHANCTSCHSPHDARSLPRGSCARCHSNVHPNHPASAKGTCVGCHDPHPGGGGAVAVPCSGCHQAARTDTGFHAGGLRCQNCHQPHQFGGQTVALCARCHAQNVQRVSSNPGHTNCLRCHQAHRPQSPAPCGSCHAEQKQTAPAGHQQCTRCHEPHSGTQRVAGCPTCHQDRARGPHRNIQGGCTNCHRQHGPGGRAQIPACTSCHQRANLPGVHSVDQHGQCRACHSGHAGPRSDRATCVACHRDRQDHEPQATQCAGCHSFGALQ